ncbi:aminotransferase class V-fold PLP-dependent enzyme [Eleftheria terrae]|uniref:aminotransferase class V-fold PLP-dependent enzyme n=1 Tax=Eleftheria terrae TaxID=1597781 RepID=UPI00263B0AAD|nr:aminotransferase class V-fold PLP-dependent enzyme [Eleftheria terrae]WKB54868.1 aminotransferase class V-fold PLP-dependent enzyme [Eleftheria terrae]
MSELSFRLPEFQQMLSTLPPVPASGLATDATFWKAVQGLYRRSQRMVNLENGFWGVMPEPVRLMHQYWSDRINEENTLWVRECWADAQEEVRATVAAALGCGVDEIVLTRGATEAMLALISGYRLLQPGDAVLYSNLDYPAMRHAMAWLRERRGVEPLCLQIPEPATRESLLQAYQDMLRRHPRIRLVLLTHLNHVTGLVTPVREVAAMAREVGAEVMVDAAHSWGQMDFRVTDLDVPFAGFNLHKWIAAPIGCGCLYIRRDRLAAIDRYLGDADFPESDIRSRVHPGTVSFAAWLSLPAALELHGRISAAAKQARVHHLRNRWVAAARALPGIEVLTPDDPGLVAGITSFRLEGRTSREDNDALVATLRDRHGIYTMRRPGAAGGDVVRVTPGVFTREDEVDRLVEALPQLLQG